jgi:hypothetical protein
MTLKKVLIEERTLDQNIELRFEIEGLSKITNDHKK